MAQLKDLLVNGDAKFLADVILDHDPTANLHAATKQYVDSQVGTGTDEKVKITDVTSGSTYLPILALTTDSTNTTTRQADISAKAFKYILTPGTSGGTSKGTAELVLGNGISEGYANSAAGRLTIYGNTYYSVTLKYQAAHTGQTLIIPAPTDTSQTNYLVSKIGSSAIGSTTQPVYVDAAGHVQTCSLTASSVGAAASTHTHVSTDITRNTTDATIATGDKLGVFSTTDNKLRSVPSTVAFDTGVSNLWLCKNGTWSAPSGLAPGSHTHGDLNNSGIVTTNPPVAIADGDAILIADASVGNALKMSAITFDGSTATQFLSKKGTWETIATAGTQVTLNGVDKSGSTASIYAPESAPTSSTGYWVGWDSTNSKAIWKKLSPTINSDSGTSSVTTLAFGGRFVISVGGESCAFNMPGNPNTNYYHTTGSWNGLTYTAAPVGSPGDLAFTIPTGTTSTTVAVGNHTHTTSISTSTATNQITLAYGSKYSISAGGTSYIFTMPSAVTSIYEANLAWGGKDFNASFGPLDAALIATLSPNRFAFTPAGCITIEYSTDAGATWTSYGATDAQKIALFGAPFLTQGFSLGKHTTAGSGTINDQLRITVDTYLNGQRIYSEIKKWVCYFTTNGAANCTWSCQVRTTQNVLAGNDTWTNIFTDVGVGGWPGYNVSNHATTIGSNNPTNTTNTQYRQFRLIFKQGTPNANYASASVSSIQGYGGVGWNTPSNIAKHGNVYSVDAGQNVTFPGIVYAPKVFVNGGVSAYSDPLTVTTTGATNYIAKFQNSTTTTASTTYTYGVRIYAPNMVASSDAAYANFAAFDIGVAASACNSGNMTFHYSGSGSTANRINFGLYSHNNILSVVATDRVGIMNTAPDYTLDVTGTIHASVGVKIGTSSEIKSIGSGLSVDANGALYATGGATGTVTGSGIGGYLAKWSGSGQSTELTVGPVLTTGTTKFLREDGTWAVPSGSDIWTESTTHGAVYPADAVLTGNTFADGSLTIIGQDLKDTTGMATGIGSINMAAYGTLSCSAQSGATSYTISSGLNAIGANSNSYDYIKSLYFFSKNGKKALKPTSVTLSGSSTVLTFSESLNPTAAITYLGYYNNCSGANSLVTAVGATNSANCNVVVGSRVVNSGFYSTVGGLRNSNSGNGCGVFGRNSINTGAYSFIAGSNNTNTKSEACLIGKGHDSSSGPDSVTAVGQYSAIASTTAFAVGNGADMASRSNAFEVHTDGRATVGAAPTADMDVATKKYVDDNSGGGGTVDSARSTSSTNALQNSVITNFTQTLPLPVYTTAGATPTSAITCAFNSNSMVGDKIMTQDGWIGTISSITYMAGIYSASANITGTNWMAPRKVTVGTSQYTITRKALEIVDGNTTTTYYIADIT